MSGLGEIDTMKNADHETQRNILIQMIKKTKEHNNMMNNKVAGILDNISQLQIEIQSLEANLATEIKNKFGTGDTVIHNMHFAEQL